MSPAVTTRAEGPAAPSSPPSGLRQWILDHDHRWLFVVSYLGLAVVLSVFVSLFWLVAIGLVHFGLELVRQAHYRDGAWNVVAHALWEVKLDLALIILALTLVLYIEVVMGILGLQSAGRAAAVSRAGTRAAARFAAWERNLRAALLTADEVARIAQAGVAMAKRVRGGNEAAGSGESEADGVLGSRSDRAGSPAWSRPWSVGDWVSVSLLAVGVLLIVTAPFLTPYDGAGAVHAVLEELRPFPTANQ